MRKLRFLAFFLLLFLLLSAISCKKDELSEGPNADPSGPADEQAGEESAPGEVPFSVRFEAGNEGFDTAAGTLLVAGVSMPRDFSKDLAELKSRLTECNAFQICLSNGDLTYHTLSGGSDPVGENMLYTISFVADDEMRTITIDDAAIRAYASENSNVSNISALIGSFTSMIAFWNGTFS
jgi:hypothetical protein